MPRWAESAAGEWCYYVDTLLQLCHVHVRVLTLSNFLQSFDLPFTTNLQLLPCSKDVAGRDLQWSPCRIGHTWHAPDLWEMAVHMISMEPAELGQLTCSSLTNLRLQTSRPEARTYDNGVNMFGHPTKDIDREWACLPNLEKLQSLRKLSVENFSLSGEVYLLESFSKLGR